MKIEYRTGNLVDTDCKLIAHGVNCQGKMKSGVAKDIRAKWPKVYTEYKRAINNVGVGLLGQILPVLLPKDNKIVFNLFTQFNYGYDGGRYMSYDALVDCLATTERFISGMDLQPKELALPTICAGRGGGDWKIIEAIIEASFVDVQPIVYRLDEK